MIVIADTSPINYLVRSEYLWILRELFREVLIPRAVLTELQHQSAPAEVRAFAEHLPTWIRVEDLSGQVREMDPALGLGEREAISLALELRADALLIDDLAGSRESVIPRSPGSGDVGCSSAGRLQRLSRFSRRIREAQTTRISNFFGTGKVRL